MPESLKAGIERMSNGTHIMSQKISATKRLRYGTAILSLTAVIGLPQSLETKRKIDGLIAAETVQRQQHNYAAAWRSLEQVAQTVPDNGKIQMDQEDLAMEWLESFQKPSVGISNIMEKLEPVFIRGVVASQSKSRQADLLAHVGWSYFLRSRERFDVDPTRTYAEAVERDPKNPYAQAMWGYWALWMGKPLADAQKHFSLALMSGRLRTYVQRLQLAGFMNGAQSYENGDIIRLVNAIRKEQAAPDHQTREYFFAVYTRELRWQKSETVAFVNAIGAEEQLATFHWLFDGWKLDKYAIPSRTFLLSVLEEVAGRRDEALAGYRLARQQDTWGGPIAGEADIALQRLVGNRRK